jgi:hypothetical protein
LDAGLFPGGLSVAIFDEFGIAGGVDPVVVRRPIDVLEI